MIKKVNIANFGSFKGLKWDANIRDKGNNVAAFKKLNIIYGRNYSGKTNLSRIIRCLETGQLPEKYEDPQFDIVVDSKEISQEEIADNDLEVRVYNKDFVDDHLSFLRDHDGKITPFAVIGSVNKDIEREISEIEKELGSVKDETGRRFKQFLHQEKLEEKKEKRDKKQKELKDKLFNKANKAPHGIKHNIYYQNPNYDIRSIKKDIKKVREESFEILPDSEIEKLKGLLDEKKLPEISSRFTFDSKLQDLIEATNSLLEKKITPTEPIQELLNDALLQNWVKEGIEHHKNKRKKCGFCGNSIPSDLWDKLDKHFSKESEILENEIEQQIVRLKDEQERIQSLINVTKQDFYSTLQEEFEELEESLSKQVKIYEEQINMQIELLEGRLESIFEEISAIDSNFVSLGINDILAEINSHVESNNEKTTTLKEEKERARKTLRLNEVANFINDINLAQEEEIIDDLKKQVIEAREKAQEIGDKVKKYEQKIDELRLEQQDEKKGAERVNDFLNNYFGHDGLRLEAVEDQEKSVFKFEIKRGDKPAYNLSEGECSLVSFCYFIAKLEDVKSKDKDLVIFIDDPISSLDSNHIFFVYSLIESIIASPISKPGEEKEYGYAQLFISTHNLDFLKYLKMLSKPKNNTQQFLLISHDGESNLKLMPSYLKKYITEFNYLFNEIYTCADPQNAEGSYQSFYSFGNNLRKFLEAFLYFKYPFSDSGRNDNAVRVEEFFSDDEPSATPLVQRITNEFSHLKERFDRGRQPIDSQEISKLARFVLKKIKDNDPVQYQYLLKSIGESDPLIEDYDGSVF